MKQTRSSRLLTACITLFCLLYMQLAVASYACPGMAVGAAAMAAAMQGDHQSMPGCATMDMQQPGLCHAHAQTGNQSLDKPDLPPVLPFTAAGLFLTLHEIDLALPSGARPSSPPLLLAGLTEPPLSIRNCCFRI